MGWWLNYPHRRSAGLGHMAADAPRPTSQPTRRKYAATADGTQNMSKPTYVTDHIAITEVLANARVDTNDVSGLCFTDYFNLLKVEGTWTIVSKVYHTNDAPKS
ncbi:nuclear transport factor 2 family protein [Streptomyces sp. NPDC060006]|uniref:nuclear transport factor 2 family protein n=1 Tax=unclassified Streptomyces TaxID=2593676 RepID=UPI0036CA58AC